MLEMAGVFEFGERKFPVDREVEFAGIGGMGFPTLPQVSFPKRDVRFANCDAGIF
jgi:hypothetical protein